MDKVQNMASGISLCYCITTHIIHTTQNRTYAQLPRYCRADQSAEYLSDLKTMTTYASKIIVAPTNIEHASPGSTFL